MDIREDQVQSDPDFLLEYAAPGPSGSLLDWEIVSLEQNCTSILPSIQPLHDWNGTAHSRVDDILLLGQPDVLDGTVPLSGDHLGLWQPSDSVGGQDWSVHESPNLWISHDQISDYSNWGSWNSYSGSDYLTPVSAVEFSDLSKSASSSICLDPTVEFFAHKDSGMILT
jgi:hypothetical protein